MFSIFTLLLFSVYKCVCSMLNVLFFYLKMHQNAFDGRKGERKFEPPLYNSKR